MKQLFSLSSLATALILISCQKESMDLPKPKTGIDTNGSSSMLLMRPKPIGPLDTAITQPVVK